MEEALHGQSFHAFAVWSISNPANLLGKKSEQQRGTGPSYMWKSMARCPFEIRHEAKQRQTKWQAQTKKSCRLLFVFLRVAFCFQDLFRSSHLCAVFLLHVASFFGFPAACVLLIFAPSTHAPACGLAFSEFLLFFLQSWLSHAWLQWLRGMLATCFLSSPMQCAAPTACPCLWQHVRCALKCVIGIADELPCCVPCIAGIA